MIFALSFGLGMPCIDPSTFLEEMGEPWCLEGCRAGSSGGGGFGVGWVTAKWVGLKIGNCRRQLSALTYKLSVL